MTTYIVSISQGYGHVQGQSSSMGILDKTGVDWNHRKWVMGRGYEHRWRIVCTEEQLTLLVLKGFTVEKNITKEAKESGLAKLTEDEKEALGLL